MCQEYPYTNVFPMPFLFLRIHRRTQDMLVKCGSFNIHLGDYITECEHHTCFNSFLEDVQKLQVSMQVFVF